MDFSEIISYAIAALGGGGLSGLVFFGLNKRQKKAEVQNQEIDNINDIVTNVYQPMITDLKARVEELATEVRSLRDERETIAQRHEDEIAAIKKDCAEKSEAMRKQIVELAGELAKKQDRQTRKSNGQYAKKN